MKLQNILSLAFLLSSVIQAQTTTVETTQSFFAGLTGTDGTRYEATGRLHCPGGVQPTIPYYQYVLDKDGAFRRIARAREFAPFLWVLRDDSTKLPAIGFYTEVHAEWVYCDDDGDTFERQRSYSHLAIYDLAGDVASPQFSRRGYARTSNQTLPRLYLAGMYGLVGKLDENLAHNDPHIDGPYDVFVRDTPATPQMKFQALEPSAGHSGFVAEFTDGCGPQIPLRVVYKPSDCAFGCSETP